MCERQIGENKTNTESDGFRLLHQIQFSLDHGTKLTKTSLKLLVPKSHVT
jgi:hypothetical protein